MTNLSNKLVGTNPEHKGGIMEVRTRLHVILRGLRSWGSEGLPPKKGQRAPMKQAQGQITVGLKAEEGGNEHF